MHPLVARASRRNATAAATSPGVGRPKGVVPAGSKNFKKAKESYLKAIEIEPDYSDAIYNMPWNN